MGKSILGSHVSNDSIPTDVPIDYDAIDKAEAKILSSSPYFQGDMRNEMADIRYRGKSPSTLIKLVVRLRSEWSDVSYAENEDILSSAIDDIHAWQLSLPMERFW